MSVFINLLVRSGVFRSLCTEPAGVEACSAQFFALSSTFNAASALTLFALLPIGLFFDRYGAHSTAVLGAVLVTVGFCLLQVSVLGALAGRDALTCWTLPVAVFILDAGSMLNSQCMLGLVWYFPQSQAFVISLGNATYQAASVLPVLLQWMMQAWGFSLSAALWVFTGAVALSTYLCHVYTPSQREFFDEAKKVLGIPLPDPPSSIDCMSSMRKANRVIGKNCRDHLWTIILASAGFTHALLYASLAGDYGEKLFGSSEDGKQLAMIFAITNCIVGGALAPMAITIVDACGIHVLTATLCILHGVTSVLIPRRSWLAQAGTCFCLVLFLALVTTFVLKYLLAYAPPNRIGTVQGVMFAYAMMLNMFNMVAVQCWMSGLPAGADQIAVPLSTAASIAFIAMVIYSVRLCIVGLPEFPALLPEDEAELAKPFGCRDLQDLCYVLHVDSRGDLIKQLARPDPSVIMELVARIDVDRMAEKLGDLGVDEFAVLIEQGAGGDAVGGENVDMSGVELAPLLPAPALPPPRLGDAPAEEAAAQAPAKRRGGRPRWSCLAWCRSQDEAVALPAVEALSAGADPEVNPLSKRMLESIRDGDKERIRELFLASPVDSIWEAFLVLEKALTPAQIEAVEKRLDSLVSGAEFAAMLRQRPELKQLLTKLAVRRMKSLMRPRAEAV